MTLKHILASTRSGFCPRKSPSSVSVFWVPSGEKICPSHTAPPVEEANQKKIGREGATRRMEREASLLGCCAVVQCGNGLNTPQTTTRIVSKLRFLSLRIPVCKLTENNILLKVLARGLCEKIHQFSSMVSSCPDGDEVVTMMMTETMPPPWWWH